MNITGKYKTEHGELELSIEGLKITGVYADNIGVLEGEIENNIVNGVWRKPTFGYEGIFQFTFTDENTFIGVYKSGLDKGAMRGKWNGSRIGTSNNAIEPNIKTIEKTQVTSEQLNNHASSGEIRDEKGNLLSGNIVNGKLHGFGKMTDNDGDVFEGDWLNGEFIKGKILYDDNSRKEGEFKNFDLHGNGKTIFFDLDDGIENIMDGYYENGEFMRGVYTYVNVKVEEGSFIDFDLVGRGKRTFVNGDYEEGLFEAGSLKEGKRKRTDENGDVFEGNIHEFEIHGEAIWRFNDGKISEQFYINGEILSEQNDIPFFLERYNNIVRDNLLEPYINLGLERSIFHLYTEDQLIETFFEPEILLLSLEFALVENRTIYDDDSLADLKKCLQHISKILKGWEDSEELYVAEYGAEVMIFDSEIQALYNSLENTSYNGDDIDLVEELSSKIRKIRTQYFKEFSAYLHFASLKKRVESYYELVDPSAPWYKNEFHLIFELKTFNEKYASLNLLNINKSPLFNDLNIDQTIEELYQLELRVQKVNRKIRKSEKDYVKGSESKPNISINPAPTPYVLVSNVKSSPNISADNEKQKLQREKELKAKAKQEEKEKIDRLKQKEKEEKERQKAKAQKQKEEEKNKTRYYKIDYSIKLTQAKKDTVVKGSVMGSIFGYDKMRFADKKTHDKGQTIQRSIRIKHNGQSMPNNIAKHHIEQNDIDVKAGRAGTSTIVILNIKES